MPFHRPSSASRSAKAIIAAAACLAYAPALFAGSGAEFHPLGFLDPDNFGPVIGYGISGDGVVVTGMSNSPTGFQAFRWNEVDGMKGLGAFANPGGFPSSQARACSNDGSVIVGSSVKPDSLNEDGSPFRWTSATGLVYLGNLGGSTGGVARGVSADGSVVVGYSSNADFNPEAFRWTSAGMIGLGDLPGGAFNSQAADVSGDGSVVVGLASTASFPYNTSFKWTPSTGMLQLGDGSFRVIGLSRDGQYAAGIKAGRAARAELATDAVTLLPHIAIPGLNTDTDAAWAANADGSVITGMQNLSQGNGFFGRAFLWDQKNGTRILRDLLVNTYGLGPQLAGWELNCATSVSDDGLTMTGYGFAPSGQQAAWLVKLPHPCLADLSGDGVIDVDDLFEVINAWGACPGCPADIDGSGEVDVDDLFAVINAWGDCP